MMHVHGGHMPTHDAMYGMYASCRYAAQEAITVYVGEDIGSARGEEDGYRGYRTLEERAGPCVDDEGNEYEGRGGRHIMEVHRSLLRRPKAVGWEHYTGEI